MPVLFLLTLTVQVLFALHAFRSGRERYWIFIILLFPGMGALIYFLAEILPDIYRGRAGQQARRKLQKALDPEKELRAAKYAFHTAPTVANRVDLARLLMESGDCDGTIALLEPALVNHFTDDVLLLEGLAYAYYGKGDCNNALSYIQRIYDRPEGAPANYIKLLRARALTASGDLDGALAELEQLVDVFSGEEARVALAQLHERMGSIAAARKIYEDIITRASHAPKYYQRQEASWIKIAKDAITRL